MTFERARLIALGIGACVLLPFVMPYTPVGFILFVPFLLWYGLWWAAIRLQERYDRKHLDEDYEKLLDGYSRDR